MGKQLTIGITGGIGSGKSTIARVFESMDYPVYYADNRAKDLMLTDNTLIKEVKKHFGLDVYFEDGSLNREKLGQIVFNDKNKLERLNSLVHPAVGRDFSTWISKQSNTILFKEAAILFEIGTYKKMDYNILVTAPKQERVARVMKRDKVTKEVVLARMKNQWEDEKKIPLADFVIDNGGDLLVIPQLLKVLNQLKKEE